MQKLTRGRYQISVYDDYKNKNSVEECNAKKWAGENVFLCEQHSWESNW